MEDSRECRVSVKCMQCRVQGFSDVLTAGFQVTIVCGMRSPKELKECRIPTVFLQRDFKECWVSAMSIQEVEGSNYVHATGF